MQERKWERRWISVGHLKLYKWIPVSARIRMQHQIDAKQESNRDTENAPITRSITAAFTRDQKISKEEKNQVDTLLGLQSEHSTSKLSTQSKTPEITTETINHKDNSKGNEITPENSNMEPEDTKQEISGQSDQSAYNSEIHSPEPQREETSDSDMNEEVEMNSATGENEFEEEEQENSSEHDEN